MRLKVLIGALLLVFACADAGPSCAEMNGSQEFSHYLTIMMPIQTGKVMVLVPYLIPMYECELPSGETLMVKGEPIRQAS